MSWLTSQTQCRMSRAIVVRILVLSNLVLALYTIPALLGNRTPTADIGGARPAVEDAEAPDAEYTGSKSREIRSRKVATEIEQFSFLNQPKVACLDDNQFLLLVVCSAVQHFHLREAIRQTWASVIQKYRISTKIVFMLGAPSGEFGHLGDHVTREASVHGDVVQADFVDSHVNLTAKTLSAIRWSLTFCPSVKFFMKVDDDVFINVANLIGVLLDAATRHMAASKPFMLGHVIKNAQPISDRYSKWYTPTVLLKTDSYPDYLSGSAYVISGSALAPVYGAAISRRPFWLEDVYITGVISRELNISLLHDEKFTFRRPEIRHPCLARLLVTMHQLSPTDMRDIWRQLHSPDLDCTGYAKRVSRSKTT